MKFNIPASEENSVHSFKNFVDYRFCVKVLELIFISLTLKALTTYMSE